MQKGRWLSQERPNRYNVQCGRSSPANDSLEELSSTGEKKQETDSRHPLYGRESVERRSGGIEVQLPTQNKRP